MRATSWIAIAALATATLGGCADERDPPPNDAERAAATALVGQMSALYDLSREPTQSGHLVAALRFDSAAQLLASNRPQVGWSSPPRLVPLPDCVTATDTTATFSGCEIEGHWVDGTLSHAGPTVNAEIVDVFILDAGSQGASSIDGTLALTRTRIDGAVDVDANWTQNERDITLHAPVTFDGVSLDGARWPVGGSLNVSGSLSAPPRVAEVTVQFGPDCGDMTVAR